MNGVNDKRLKVKLTDLKKKPSFELLQCIGKVASQDITPHAFAKVKPPKGPKIEEIFIKQSNKNIKGGKKIDKQPIKSKSNKLKKKKSK